MPHVVEQHAAFFIYHVLHNIIIPNMKKFLLLTVILGLISTAFAADEAKKDEFGWKTNGTIGANLTQVSLTNWAGGGQNTIAITGLFNYTFNNKTEVSMWENSLDIGYGMTKLADNDFRKSDDKIIFISKYGYNATEHISYAALLDFRTQLDKGYLYNAKADTIDKLISNFLAPANLLVGLGATYKPTEYLTITLAPLANRLLIVADTKLQDGSLGTDSGKAIRSDLGAQFNATLKKELITNVGLESKLVVFAPYAAFTTQLVNWNTLLTLKVNDYINASFALDVIYDPRVVIKRDDGTSGPSTQIRNVIGIGFGYMF